ncbi:MAG TPA: delta-60 repeat domain-containing protein [Pirellulales bacterium]|nr:delta-60 repeat domain-containing protein [Pirellulales bacterium]
MVRLASSFFPRQRPAAKSRLKPSRRRRSRHVQVEFLEQRSMLAAGVLDTTFGSGGVALTPIGTGNADLFDMAIEPDGKLVAVGLAQGQGYAVARYNADGSLDTTFGTSGTEIIPSTGSAHRVAIQSDGKIVLSGDTNGAPDQTVVVRLTDSGALDSTFGTAGKVTVGTGGGSALAIDPSGRIIVAGGGTGITRLNSDGTLDTTFGIMGKKMG